MERQSALGRWAICGVAVVTTLVGCADTARIGPSLVSASGVSGDLDVARRGPGSGDGDTGTGSDAGAGSGGGADAGFAADTGELADVVAPADAAPDSAEDATPPQPDTNQPDMPLADTAAPDDSGASVEVGPPDVQPPPDISQPQDLEPVDAAPPPDVPPPVDVPPAAFCGDGVCQSGSETAASCPGDCGGWLACAGVNCATSLAACSNAGPCATATQCAKSCKDVGCVSDCSKTMDYPTMVNVLIPLATCAQKQGCITGSPPGPGGGPSTCGNGACDNGETHLTCPGDCPFPAFAGEQCQAQKCAQSFGACAADKGCIQVATCWNKGGGQSCLSNNTSSSKLLALINCASANCSGSPPPQTSCPGKCGDYVKGAACQCDSKCQEYKDCCTNYKSKCGG